MNDSCIDCDRSRPPKRPATVRRTAITIRSPAAGSDIGDSPSERGAGYMDLGTSEDDVAARALYESFGFSNREGRAAGPVNFSYEREL